MNSSISNKKIGIIVMISAAVLVPLLLMAFCFRTVAEGQVGIVTRYGAVNRIVGPGPVWKLPFVEKVVRMDVRQLKFERNDAAATKDLQDVNSKVAVNYSLTPDQAISVYKHVGIDYANVIIDPIIQAGIRTITSQYNAADLVTQRPKVQKELSDLLVSKLTDRGITVGTVSFENLAFSPEFNKAIEAVQVANQNISKARQELETTKVEAEKRVTEATAAAEAQRLQQQTLTPELLQKQAIEKWNGDVPTYYGQGGGFLFNIPLQGN